MHFNQRLVSCDFDQNIATFESVVWKPASQIPEGDLVNDVIGDELKPVAKTAQEVADQKRKPVHTSKMTKVPFDFIIGADGTYSSVRQNMMRKSHMNFSQVYVHALWCDFIFPARKSDGDYPLDSKCLHVWPADQSIVMAQPDFVSPDSDSYPWPNISLTIFRITLSELVWCVIPSKFGN